MAQATTTDRTTPAADDRFDRPVLAKFEIRRGELADAALATLGDLGYARTSLREIAQKSDFSHGVLHYYFRDKAELITFCVRRYKEGCVSRYDQIVAESATAPDLATAFAEGLVATLREDTAMHRLWYDLRCQAMFETDLAETVRDLDRQLENMILRVLERYAELARAECVLSPAGAYAVFDGTFENALHRHHHDSVQAAELLRSEIPLLLAALIRGD
ncbi:TetR/AcrR family transcriptional regulator [Demetria terragena]|uniref:TetR/AcrR family transcriptional regulator n=1 Tax=Demetria terragena TaxID=63959 RepID=UPI00047648B6|nr:TetR/AcrR family transcriptional regulator [Demetria terragena]